MARRFFAAGCWMLIVTGLLHLVGHYSLMTSQGENETERQLFSLLRGYKQDMGLGFVRSTMDIVAGFSLTVSILPLGTGLLGFVLRRYVDGAPGLLWQAAVVYAGVYGIMTGVALRYWFPVPLFFLAACFLCFASAVATAPRPPA